MVLHPVSGAHHANYASGSGFCTFNFLVGGAVELLRMGLHRVAIIDLDAHPGDGTYRLSRGREGIALFDRRRQLGGRRQHPSVEYHVARDASHYGWRSATSRRSWTASDRRLVMFQAGMDPYEHDPVGGIPGVDEAFLRRRDSHVIHEVSWRRIPLVVNIAGGYVDGVERLHLMTVRAMAMGLA